MHVLKIHPTYCWKWWTSWTIFHNKQKSQWLSKLHLVTLTTFPYYDLCLGAINKDHNLPLTMITYMEGVQVNIVYNRLCFSVQSGLFLPFIHNPYLHCSSILVELYSTNKPSFYTTSMHSYNSISFDFLWNKAGIKTTPQLSPYYTTTSYSKLFFLVKLTIEEAIISMTRNWFDKDVASLSALIWTWLINYGITQYLPLTHSQPNFI